MSSDSQSTEPNKDLLRYDADGDGVDDLIVVDTNGHTVYVNLRWVIGLGSTLVAAIGGLGVLLW